MHIPDGFINAGTSTAAGVVAAVGVGVCIRQASRTLDEKQVPMAGVAAAFIFAVQMLNFPVASGTSGHLLGGVLAAALVGPWAGALCVTVVLVVQGLVFADGGLSALGLNIVNMAFVVLGVIRGARRCDVSYRRPGRAVVATAIAPDWRWSWP
jgi:cobalt/nickel transport system permease protein